MPGIIIILKYSGQFFLFYWDGESVSEYSVLRNYLRKYMQNGKNNTKLKKDPPRFSPALAKMMEKYFDMEFRYHSYKFSGLAGSLE